MTQRNEVWAQGSEPGDAPISSVTVPIDAGLAAREAARARLRTFAQGPRPNGGPPDTLQQRVHDMAVVLSLTE